MRIAQRVCPNRCLDPVQRKLGRHRYRQRLTVHISLEDCHAPTVNGQKVSGADILLDWYCPVCGFTMPMCYDDLRQKSRKPRVFGLQRGNREVKWHDHDHHIEKGVADE